MEEQPLDYGAVVEEKASMSDRGSNTKRRVLPNNERHAMKQLPQLVVAAVQGGGSIGERTIPRRWERSSPCSLGVTCSRRSCQARRGRDVGERRPGGPMAWIQSCLSLSLLCGCRR